MSDEDGFGKPPSSPGFAAAAAVGEESSAPSSQQQEEEQPQMQQQSSYAMRRYASGGGGGGGSPLAGGAGAAQPITIPANLQIDMKRVVLDDAASSREGSPTSPSAGGADSPKKKSGEVIGTGAFGTVVRGELLPDEKSPGGQNSDNLSASSSMSALSAPVPVAIKILDKAKCENSTFMSLQSELDVSGELRHPCLVNTLGVGVLPARSSPLHVESIAIVMELAARGELLKYMKRYGLEDMPEVAPKFVAEAILSLEFMASRGLAHRDLKPENLLLTAECHVKLSDFGTVCKLDSADAAVFRGTTAYAAPEVLTPGGAVAATTDLWALGCVVYELFVGRPPFQADSDYLLRQVIRSRELDFPPYFPAAARDLVSQLLEVDPAKRLGAAARGGFASLKAHPFFAHVCWETLLQQSHVTTLNADFQAEVGPLLLDGEEIVFAGHIKKERFLSVKQRLLVLTTFPRLFYIEPGTFTIKGQVPWSDEIAAEAESPTVFRVHTGEGQRVYHFTDFNGQRAMTWAAKINAAVMEQKAKKRMSKK